jgi:uncharacterized membrane protein YidH (DUF202 family)
LTGGALFDPGLQPERTALAWRRTALTLGAGSIVSVRLFAPEPAAWSIGVRARRTRDALLGSGGRLPGGGIILYLAIFVACAAAAALLEMAVVAHSATSWSRRPRSDSAHMATAGVTPAGGHRQPCRS